MQIEMFPSPGENLLRFAGDRVSFRLETPQTAAQAFLRTNLGRAGRLHAEIAQEYKEELAQWQLAPSRAPRTLVPKGMAWRDVPMVWKEGAWRIEMTAAEAGFFQAKAYAVDERGRQIWPEGPDVGISVHPNEYRSANTIYCAFTRMFGETKGAAAAGSELEPHLARLEKLGYSVLPPSGKLRDLVKAIPHIFDTLGCRILHLLPVSPVPATYARFGRFGSPYAVLDLMGIDPALVEFDRRTTGVDQFRELTFAVHERGGRLILDIVINHTGWGSNLQENHPEWFLRDAKGVFVSPGAWGTTWEDLVELDHRMPLSWEYLAEVFITWCRRGVDGFRCDAGYKIPTPAWRYIIARVRHEFPDALFLLEGLGGAWEATEDLLTRGGMQWAYSELFQNRTPEQVSGYLDHSLEASGRAGILVHYSETHDNDRLGAKGREWSLARNQLAALSSHSGAFGFTCGAEWLAAEKINVHSSRGMAWGASPNLVAELSRLNAFLSEHPCFFDGARVKRLSGADSAVLALERASADGEDQVLALVNLDHEQPASFFLPAEKYFALGEEVWDLLRLRKFRPRAHGKNIEFALEAGQSVCLAVDREPRGLSGEAYRKRRKQHAWAIEALSHYLEPEELGPHEWAELARWVEQQPKVFLGAIRAVSASLASRNLLSALASAAAEEHYPEVVAWTPADERRVTPVPPGHWLMIEDSAPFRAALRWGGRFEHKESVPVQGMHIAAFRPVDILGRQRNGAAEIALERYGTRYPEAKGALLYLEAAGAFEQEHPMPIEPRGSALNAPAALLTNSIGGMARFCVDLGSVKSKYDCVLGANLHPAVPVDRHVFVKRMRVWANADRFISPLNSLNLQAFSPGPPARWEFAAIRGDGRTARIELKADMIAERNATVFQFKLLEPEGPDAGEVRLAIRFDIEDRNFHTETHRNSAAEHHFASHCHPLRGEAGFEFRPAANRVLSIHAAAGQYHHAGEWSAGIMHAVEQSRGQAPSGDAYSPGWFDLPLAPGKAELVILTAEKAGAPLELAANFETRRKAANEAAAGRANLPPEDSFGRQLALAAQAFVVRRGANKTVIAGYPWFLDWGRDTLICARGLLSAGLFDEVRQLLIAFGRFEQGGTLPNTIHGEDASNRDTSDAPLWYGVVCEEFARLAGPAIYDVAVDGGGRKIRDVLLGIAAGYLDGTPNGIRVDEHSGLVWSPRHFTWMDTNYPAGTPREGYPIEIQALWIRLLRHLDRIGAPPHNGPWETLARKALGQLLERYWLPEKGWLADCLAAAPGLSALEAAPDDALRSNCLFPVVFGLIPPAQARRCLDAAARWLVVPGALRSLAPLRVAHPLPIHGPDWRLLNDPREPYWGQYQGDEDTQRKPAYHNGTAWTWTFPTFCEALARVWDFSPEAVAAARSYLGSMAALLQEGCIGHIPEVLDGDAPHQQRGCDAQAWGVTEALRVLKILSTVEGNGVAGI